jgi:hypothetical protein
MESGEEIRYGIEEAVVRLLAWSICTFTALIQLLFLFLSVLLKVRWWPRYNTGTRLRTWLIMATMLKHSILPSYPTPPLRPSHSPA